MDTSTPTPDELEKIVEGYEALRLKVYHAARRNDGELMGADAWLRFAMGEQEIEMSVGSTGIDCWGTTYTMQTVSHESFSFFIPFEEL